MPSAPRFFLREDGRRTSTHSLSVLKQKAEMDLLSADTLLAQENEPEAWAALRESQVLNEELLPARSHCTLAPSEIISVNHAENPSTRYESRCYEQTSLAYSKSNPNYSNRFHPAPIDA